MAGKRSRVMAGGGAVVALVLGTAVWLQSGSAAQTVTVYKTPT